MTISRECVFVIDRRWRHFKFCGRNKMKRGDENAYSNYENSIENCEN